MSPFIDSGTPPREWRLQTDAAATQRLAAQGVAIHSLLMGPLTGLVALVRDRARLSEIGLAMCGSDKDGKDPTLIAGDVERLAAAALEAIPDFFSDPPGVDACRQRLAMAQRIIDREAAQAAAAAAEVQTSAPPAPPPIKPPETMPLATPTGPATPPLAEPAASTTQESHEPHV